MFCQINSQSPPLIKSITEAIALLRPAISLRLPSLAASPRGPNTPLHAVTLEPSVLSPTPPLHLGVQLSPNPTKPPVDLHLVTSSQTQVTSAFGPNPPITQDTVAISHQSAGKPALSMKPNPGRVVAAPSQTRTVTRLRLSTEGARPSGFSNGHSVRLRCCTCTVTLKETTAMWTGSKGTATRTQRLRRTDRSRTFYIHILESKKV